jgi:putative transposase
MARPLRLQTPGYYHVTTRGNDRMDIYVDDVDRRLFIAFLGLIAERAEWTLHAWCLMTNHFHLVVEDRHVNLSNGMQLLNGRYARAFNDRHERTGHLFGRRFWAGLIESDKELFDTAEYVFDNPVRAGLCASRPEWPWLGGVLRPFAVAA